ncbi:ubiquitin domain-containing protein UBFD1-like [Symsagittifera roscoffensis]|uniref:ubiquitin domain-containing protein UBFD1-like n=1 Tax=Symsagittifera roscoffensis TaxID=84072 RepID=UPI00307B5853
MSENSPPNESGAKTSLGDQEESHGAMNGDSAVDNNSASGSLTPGEIEPNEKKARTTEDDPAEPSTEKAEQIVPGIEEAPENVEEKKGESASADVPETTNEEKPEDFITVKVAYNKTIYDTKIAKSKTVLDLKKELQKSTGVPESLQKLMYKGKLTDSMKISESSLINGCKVLLIGSKPSDVVQVNKVPTKSELLDDPTEVKSKEPLCEQTQHKKVLDKGKPENLMLGIKGSKEALPTAPLSGMIKQDGGNIRLTFKLESDELWIGTKERTHKLPMNSIKSVHSEAIKGHEEYSIVGIQTGPTLKSTIWVYWVPSQYVDSIKDTILGSFLF